MTVMVKAFDGCVLDRSVHPFDLTVGPGMVGLCQAVFDPVGLADHVEAHGPGIDGVPVSGLLGKLNTPRRGHSDQWRSNGSIRENGVDLIGHCFEHSLQELPCCLPVCLIDDLGHGKLACAVNADEQIKLSLGGLNFRDVDVKEADGVAFDRQR